MRISAPLRQKGARAQRWSAWQQRTRGILIARSKGLCEVTKQSNVAREGHHLFGRREEPWSSHPACMVLVAVPVHQDLERELLQPLHESLRWAALEELALAFNELPWFLRTNRIGESAMDAWRRLLPHLEERLEYDAASNRIVRRPGWEL